jgi:hypothetical protein
MEELKLYNKQEQIKGPIDDEARKIQFRLLRPLGKAYNIIVYIYKSLNKIIKFKELIGKMVLMDNRTR